MDVLKEREGIIVLTDYERVIKRASNPIGIRGIKNAVRFYQALQDTPWVPKLYRYTDTEIEREYIKVELDGYYIEFSNAQLLEDKVVATATFLETDDD